MGVSKYSGTPKWMVKIMENPIIKWMIWRENPPFTETPILEKLKKRASGGLFKVSFWGDYTRG